MARKSSVLSVLITGDAGPLIKATKNAAGTLADFGKKAGVALAAAGAAAAVVATKLIKAGEEASTANARIGNIVQTMDLFGEETGKVTERLIKNGEALARLTGVETKAIKETQGILLTFKELAATADEQGGAFDRASKAALDLAAAGFGSAQSNATQLGKALQDPIKGLTALTRSGVTFTDAEREKIRALTESGKVLEAQNMILSAIEGQVGGTAEATANASDRMRVAFSQAQERLGLALLPAFEQLSGFVIDQVVPAVEQYLAPAMEKLSDIIGRIVPLVIKFAGEMLGKLSPGVEAVGGFLSKTLVPAMLSLWESVQKNVLPIVRQLVDYFVNVTIPMMRNVLVPIIGGLVDAFRRVVATVGENSDKFQELFARLRVIGEFMRDVVAPVVGVLVAGAFRTLGNIISFLLPKLLDFLNFILAIIQRVIELTRRLAESPIGQAVGGIVERIAARARGGPVSGGTPYLVGERGPELFVPTGSGRVVANDRMGGGGVVINVSGAIDPEATARQIRRVLQDAERRTGVRL
jgi:hypothetical protein